MKHLKDIKYDWIISSFYKEKNMSRWASEYIKNNDIDFELLRKELQELIDYDNSLGLNSFNRYGSFEMLWSSVPNALLSALINASKNKK
jgi:hypothetical protein